MTNSRVAFLPGTILFDTEWRVTATEQNGSKPEAAKEHLLFRGNIKGNHLIIVKKLPISQLGQYRVSSSGSSFASFPVWLLGLHAGIAVGLLILLVFSGRFDLEH